MKQHVLAYSEAIIRFTMLTIGDSIYLRSDRHMQHKTVSVLHTIPSTTVENQHTRCHPIVISICNTRLCQYHSQYPAPQYKHTRCMFYRSLTPALSATRKGQLTPPRSHMRPLRWYKPNHTCVPDTRVNYHLSPPPPNANSRGPTEPNDNKPHLGYYMPTTLMHVPLLICLGDSSQHISAPSYMQSFLIYTL